jgi:hypothetical protein
MAEDGESERLTLFRTALEGCKQLAASGQSVSRTALSSIMEQLTHLIDLETGARRDSAAVARMTIGVLTAREIDEAGYEDLAQLLYRVSAALRDSR